MTGRTPAPDRRRAVHRLGTAAATVLCGALLPFAGPVGPFPEVVGAAARAQETAEEGERIYERWCAECHGAEGRGDGPAADRMLPRPRDFTEARYQVRTTASGSLPTDEDLLHALRAGLPGTTMPGWPNLARGERRAVVSYIKSFSPFFGQLEPEPVELGSDPGGGEEAVRSGREVYRTLECFKCHGEAGRGDGPSAPTLEDWRDLPIRAADLTEPWFFNGGSSVEEIHARFMTGLDGTPMPTQSDALAAGVVTEEELWDLAHYVRSLAPERVPPRVRDAARVERIEGELPDDPHDERWDGIRAHYFPLAGQVIERPRNFAPSVDGLWLQGVHDGEEIVLRVAWSDPSASPDTAWMEWQRKIARTLDDDGTPFPTDPLPDALALQFPPEVPEGRRRPYFLMGEPRAPVYQWRWDSRDGVSEARASGLGTAQRLQDESEVTGSAAWNDGRWLVTLRRRLDPEGEGRIRFPEGVPVPVAFFAWDGSSAETGARTSVSTWYFLVLEEPASRGVYVAPVIAMLLVGGLGLVAVRRARGAATGGKG